MRHKITLSYNGSEYSGWQIQNNATTVQGELDRALSILFGKAIHTTGAGRTDTGVNAVNYVCHFDLDDESTNAWTPDDKDNIIYKINAILPAGIVVHEITEAEEDFHARFGAKSREYRYFIHRRKDPFSGSFSYYCRYPLNLEKMNEACRYLLGTHDFSCFEKTGGNNATSICSVSEAVWESYSPVHQSIMGFDADKDDYLVFKIRADRFLRNMVRAVVGSLIEVGRGKREPEWVAELIASGSRCDAGESVPGKALFLCKVEY